MKNICMHLLEVLLFLFITLFLFEGCAKNPPIKKDIKVIKYQKVKKNEIIDMFKKELKLDNYSLDETKTSNKGIVSLGYRFFNEKK